MFIKNKNKAEINLLTLWHSLSLNQFKSTISNGRDENKFSLRLANSQKFNDNHGL